MTRPVIVAAGGTGGHVVPALAVAEVLKSRDIPVVWCGTRSGLEARLVPEHNIEIHWITVAGLRGKALMSRLLGPLQLVRACAQSLYLLLTLKPRAVLGMGGFVSGPVGIAAVLLRKPLILHEQNATAGMTNRYLSAAATRVFSAWPNAFKASRSALVVGNPVSSSIAELADHERQIQTDSSVPLRLLVVGGSRGARALNTQVPAAVAMLDRPLLVTHQAGMTDSDHVRDLYKQATAATVEVKDFIDDMANAYKAADLVICRSGAMTVTELSASSLPSILVPYPHAVDDHQTLNAAYLSDNGAASLLPQSELCAHTLSSLLASFIEDRQQLVRMSAAARACFSEHAAETVADALIEVSR